MGDLMKQAQELQERLSKVQEDAAARTVEGSAGGMVKATVNGRMELVRLQIEPSLLQGGDVAMLEDLIVAAVNQAARGTAADGRGDEPAHRRRRFRG